MRALHLFPLAIAAVFPAVVQGAPAPEDVFRKAVRNQGALRRDDVQDIKLTFKGEIEQDGVHSLVRVYWYRSKDRSFRVKTTSGADRRRSSERGVFGAETYWERTSDGEVKTLKPANQEHVRVRQTIEKDRSDFERMLKMVLLSRLDDGASRLVFGAAEPVRLLRDAPFEAAAALGENREEQTYYVVDVLRKREPRLRLFIHTKDYTVRKAVQFRSKSDVPRWIYYFGPYGMHPALKLKLPQYFSLYDREPVDEKTKKERNKIRGVPKVELNVGLKDKDLRPPSGARNASRAPGK